MFDATTTIAALKKNGHKLTDARIALVSTFAESPGPLTVLEIGKRLRARRIAAHKTTLYREIAFLLEQGIVRAVRFGDEALRYEANDDHHHHIVCISCKRVEDVELPRDLEVEERAIMRRTGFTALRHSLEFFGLCGRCA